MSRFEYIAGPMRLPFLILTPACVLVGVATAAFQNGSFNYLFALFALIGALAAHISVNALNEYFDFKSGLDATTERTPFSGGSGTLPANPKAAGSALFTAFFFLLLILVIGIYFISVYNMDIFPLGLLGMLVIVFYTPLITKSPLLCLLAPGLGFGPLMVMGTHFVLTGAYSLISFASSLIPFFLVSNLLLLNQYPDVEADQNIGRKHFPIVIGKKMSNYIFLINLSLTYLTILIGVAGRLFPPWSLLGLLTIFIAIPMSMGILRNYKEIPKLIPSMGMNVLINILTPVLFAIGFFIAK